MTSLFRALCLAGLLATPAVAGETIAWGGPGWYVHSQMKTAGQGGSVGHVGGPYSDENACKAQLPSWYSGDTAGEFNFWCDYETVAWATADDDW